MYFSKLIIYFTTFIVWNFFVKRNQEIRYYIIAFLRHQIYFLYVTVKPFNDITPK